MDAMLMIEADIELPILLGHLVEEATSLVSARYGALGVLNQARTGLEEFLTVGLSESEEQAIGPRPTGRGVLGLLITDPSPLRLRELATHTYSYGFPPNHPPMKSFLGVPVRAKGEVFGNLYLTDKTISEIRTTIFELGDSSIPGGLRQVGGVADELAPNLCVRPQLRFQGAIDTMFLSRPPITSSSS